MMLNFGIMLPVTQLSPRPIKVSSKCLIFPKWNILLTYKLTSSSVIIISDDRSELWIQLNTGEILWPQRLYDVLLSSSHSVSMFGSINLILVKANKFVTINFSVSTRNIREGKTDLNWPIKLTMSLSFILNWTQTTSFKMTSFFTKCSVCGGQEGQARFPCTGYWPSDG